MTLGEMLAEYNKDLPEIRAEGRRFLISQGFKQARAKGVRFPYQIVHNFRTTRGNRYLIQTIFMSRRDAFRDDNCEFAKALIQTSEGLAMYTASMGADGKVGSFYFQPHLFRRYRERMALNYGELDVIRTFIKRNMEFVYQEGYRRKGHEDDDKEIMMSCQDGAIFGRIDDEDENSAVFRTFISSETMQKGYKASFDREFDKKSDESLKELLLTNPFIGERALIARQARKPAKKGKESRKKQQPINPKSTEERPDIDIGLIKDDMQRGRAFLEKLQSTENQLKDCLN